MNLINIRMKLTLLLICAFTFSIMLKAQDVKVTQIVPLTCKTGEKCTIEIEIEKKGIEGFARIQQPLPEGFTATVLQDGGADFNFDKQKVSFIWLSLPASPVIRVAYQITVSTETKGIFTLSEGIFSYILDNKINKTTIAPANIEVNSKGASPGVAMSQEHPKAVEPAPKVIEPAPKPVEPEPKIIEPAPKPVEPEPKIIEPAPKPVEPEPKLIEPAPKPVEPEPKLIEPAPKPVEPEPKLIEPAPKPVEPEPKIIEPAPKPAVPAASPQESSGITYRVQFSALKNHKEPEELQRQFEIRENVICESADGWYRYSFGSWSKKADADAACKAFNTRTGKSAFVVKFSGGKRMAN
jgi:hypothetical protein